MHLEGAKILTQIIVSIKLTMEKSQVLIEDISEMIKLGTDYKENYKFLEVIKDEKYKNLKDHFLQWLTSMDKKSVETAIDGKWYKSILKLETMYMFQDWYEDTSTRLLPDFTDPDLVEYLRKNKHESYYNKIMGIIPKKGEPAKLSGSLFNLKHAQKN